MTLLKLFYFMNFFVRQIFKNVAVFALAAGIKMPCQKPPDPPKPNFFGGPKTLIPAPRAAKLFLRFLNRHERKF